MSKYVMSDLHGCYDEFMRMLKIIEFGDNDELYILGDIMDRGPNPIKILDYIISRKNITLIKGNHELFLQEYLEEKDAHSWFYNGGRKTYIQLFKEYPHMIDALPDYLRSLPILKVVDKFILVHAGLFIYRNYKENEIDELIGEQEEEVCLWDRSGIGSSLGIEGYTIICGHTPVQTIVDDISHNSIIYKNDKIFIDCGCVFKQANGRLACLRLDDMKEFYVE